MHEVDYVDMRVFFDPEKSSGKPLFQDDFGYDVLTIFPELISSCLALHIADGLQDNCFAF